MPQKDDFLSRLQAQLRETLELASKLSAEGRPDDALSVVRTAQRNLLGLEPALLSRLPSAELLKLLGPAGTPDTERTLSCAELLSAEFDILTLKGEADPVQAEKVLTLYLTVFAAEPGFAPAYTPRLAVLTQSPDDVPPATRHALAEVYRAAGNFGEAENWLYRWRDLEPDAAQGWGELFYCELLTLSDETLVEGGLPRDEVEEGLAEVSRVVT